MAHIYIDLCVFFISFITYLMELSFVFMIIWFCLAAYSVIANDSIQTLGTFLESNKKTAWRKLATAASAIAVAVIVYSWVVNWGDISWWRLSTKGIDFPEVFTIWHAIAPLWLLVLTRYGIPVSTSLLILSVFATSSTITKMVSKSVMWYAIAFLVAYVLRFVIVGLYEKIVENKKEFGWFDWISDHINWRYLQWFSTWYLWSVWLMHDMANIAVYLPRNMWIEYLIFTLVIIVWWLFYIFWRRWGKIQNIVSSKSWTDYIKAATLIDFIYACVLLYFKELNSIPMSTTWVFVWLLAGRELALSHFKLHGQAIRAVFPMILKDFAKVLFGLIISVGLAMAVWGVSGL